MTDMPAQTDTPEMAQAALNAPEVEIVTCRKIACSGDEARGLGHPRVWLAISPETGMVECGYCGKRFVLDPEAADSGH